MENTKFERVMSSISWITFIICMTLVIISTYILFISVQAYKSQGDLIDKGIEAYKLMNQNYTVEWLYKCPDYQYDFFNCPRDLKVMNMTGLICNGSIICQNTYIVHNNNLKLYN